MKIKVHRELPVGGPGCGDLRIGGSLVNISVMYEYYDGVAKAESVGTVNFTYARAMRFCSEPLARGWDRQAYDTLIEIEDSPWIRELAAPEPEGGMPTTIRTAKHFAIYFSNNGYLEVVASTYSESVPRIGVL